MHNRFFNFASSFLLVFALLMPTRVMGAPAGQKMDIIIKFHSGTSLPEQARALIKYGLQQERNVYGTDVIVARGHTSNAVQILTELRNERIVAYAELDHVAHADWSPNDTSLAEQWGLEKTSTPSGWDYTIGSASVLIAVVDSGVDAGHPDLAGKVRTDMAYNFLTNSASADDDYGHGTHVAGIAAASTNNGLGIAGMCPGCTILPVKVLDGSGNGSYSNIASGIRYAADMGAHVINISLGGASPSVTLEDALNYAAAQGALLVCSAGNNNTSSPNYPAKYDPCVAVAATDSRDSKASSSNYGDWVDVSAPGVGILSTFPGGGYMALTGTSMATPHVSGLAGLMFSQGRTLQDVRVRLTAKEFTDAVRSRTIPRRINAYKALSL